MNNEEKYKEYLATITKDDPTKMRMSKKKEIGKGERMKAILS